MLFTLGALDRAHRLSSAPRRCPIVGSKRAQAHPSSRRKEGAWPCKISRRLVGEIVMSAPSDRLHDPNSVSFYAREGQRAVRVAQVSEAAAALIPETSWDDRGSHAPADVPEEDSAEQRLDVRHSLDLEVFPEPQMSRHGRSWLASTLRFVLVIAAALLA